MDFTIEKGERLRSYDYDPKNVDGKEIYLEGRVIGTETHPYPAYRVICETCTFTNAERVGKEILVPLELAHNDFEGRIIKIS